MNLNQDFDKACAAHAGREALVYSPAPGQERSWTYGELRDKVLRAAAAFRARGIGRGDCVAILHRNDPAFIVAYFGLLRLGAVAVPVNFMIQKPEELGYILGHCEAKGVVTQKDFLPGLTAAKAKLPALARVWTTDSGSEPFWDMVDSAQPLDSAEPARPDDTVMLLYTSGTTGFPKGVMLTHANLVSNCEATARMMELSADDTWLGLLPMFHTFGWTVNTLLPLRLGGKIVIAVSVAPPEPWLAQVGRHKVTMMALVPQIYALLSSKAAGYRDLILREGYFASLRLCVSGAAPLNAQVHKDFMDAFGLEITEGFGLTETSPVASLNPLGAPKVGSIGKPIPGVSLRVVDDSGADLPPGQEGELLIQGPNVMKGYYRNEEATRETILPGGWLKSGDVAARDEEGYFFIRDRKKDMIIVKGLKVFSVQVERVLAGHPAVAEAAVIGVPDETGDERIKAFIVLKQGASADLAELHRFCRENLDAYKRPKDVEIVAALPKNALQKTLKRVLRDQELAKSKRAAAAA